MLRRYDGHIAGFATADGRRVVVGRWLRSPHGGFADVMTQDAHGRRTLLAATRAVADEIAATYQFDDVLVVPVSVVADAAARQWRVAAGPLRADVRIGARTSVGTLLAAVPRPVTRSRMFATAVDPVARVSLPGVRTRGSAGGGRREWYGAADQHRILDVRAAWDGTPCGTLLGWVPPVGFGFSSVPRAPTVTAVRTTIEVPPVLRGWW